jgi:hypothetical protein
VTAREPAAAVVCDWSRTSTVIAKAKVARKIPNASFVRNERTKVRRTRGES